MFPVIRSSAQWKEVRHKICLIQVARALLGEPEEQRGDSFHWFCPFHDGTEPCLQITRGKFCWRCLGCHHQGDAIDLVRCVRETTFSKALEFLSRPEFYRDEEEIRPEPLVFDGKIVPGESTGDDDNNDNWIEDLLRSDSESVPET